MPHTKGEDPDLIAKTEQLSKVVTTELHAYLLSLIPSPQRVVDVNNRHQESYAASLKGSPEDIKKCEESREESRQLHNLYQALGKAFAKVDPKVPQMLGFEQPNEKLTSAVPVLAEPQDFRVVYNPKGQLVGGLSRVLGAKAYEVWGCYGDPMVESNWIRLAESFNCRGIIIAGYEKGKVLWLKVRAIRNDGPGPWSNVVVINPT
ncbi:hypothetical protein GMST_33610 [Geomonas silvestris]|uniref:Uncharacterized protein n=1 Tax=Geomonas silvestris TaxID=2740184 RepID=A0A6V8MM08_9BACT|nr:hypothetical protein [Geomonas silvestris]GFO61036.1 hypothetical protein GMST_33610 [Geomonas silvestris]